MAAPRRLKARALVVARTYPVPDESGIESSCTAAITEEGEWLRIYPVPWRLLPEQQRFRKYDWVDFDLVKATGDTRAESYHLQQGGISIVSKAESWRAKKEVVMPRLSHCLCCIAKERDAKQSPTLGIVRPTAIHRLRIAPDPEPWTEAQIGMLRQQHFFAHAPEQELEKIPFKFYYEFNCPEPGCSTHRLMCTDWEMGQSFRSWRTAYGDAWQAKFRETYESEMIHKNDTHFFVGTVAAHPNRWIIIGLFYPPPDAQLSLFA